MPHAHPHILPAAIGLGLALGVAPLAAHAGSVELATQGIADRPRVVPLRAAADPVRGAASGTPPATGEIDATARPPAPAHDASPATTALIVPPPPEVPTPASDPAAPPDSAGAAEGVAARSAADPVNADIEDSPGDERRATSQPSPAPARPYSPESSAAADQVFCSERVPMLARYAGEMVGFLDAPRRDAPAFVPASHPPKPDPTAPLVSTAGPGQPALTLMPDA